MLLAYVQIGMFYIRYCTYASYIASKPFCDVSLPKCMKFRKLAQTVNLERDG